MMMSCEIPNEVKEYIDLVKRGRHRTCQEQSALVSYVEKVFETEDIYVDKKQMERYMSLAKYFPFKELFPWEKFLITLWDCTYRNDGLPS